jgi:hypothetical protein
MWKSLYDKDFRHRRSPDYEYGCKRPYLLA